MMNERLVYPLFSTPVYVNNVGAFERPDLKSLEYSSRTPAGGVSPFMSSVDKNVLDRPEFEKVRELVMREVDYYAREVCRVSKSIEFYVTNSWINVYRRGDRAGPHMHHNSLISGVLYLKAAETAGAGGEIVFHRDVHSLVPFPPALDLDMDSFNLYNCKSWAHKPKTNDICLFPSVVSHSVEPNGSDEQRWSLAFNIFVRGSIGSMHRLTLR
jgi:uncharacterized protein (TIGR02466 family)